MPKTAPNPVQSATSLTKKETTKKSSPKSSTNMKDNKWIQRIPLKKGALPHQLGIPLAKNIPISLLVKIKNTDTGIYIPLPPISNKQRIKVTLLLKRRANFALNVKRINR